MLIYLYNFAIIGNLDTNIAARTRPLIDWTSELMLPTIITQPAVVSSQRRRPFANNRECRRPFPGDRTAVYVEPARSVPAARKIRARASSPRGT